MASGLIEFSQHVADLVDAAAPSVVSVFGRRRSPSSGVVWREGLVVTCDHTLDREDGFEVALPDRSRVPATLAGRDRGSDLAVLRIESKAATPVRAASPASLRAGNLAVLVGRSPDAGPTASLGIVSAVSGEWRSWRGGRLDKFVRIDASLFPLTDGGLVIDSSGAAIGIATGALSRFSPLAIPVETVNMVVDAVLAHGEVPKPYLGVGLHPVRLPESLRKLVSSETALAVLSVEENSPASRAGLLIGDLLFSLSGKTLADTDDVQSALEAAGPGAALPARVLRGGEPRDLTFTVGSKSGGTRS